MTDWVTEYAINESRYWGPSMSTISVAFVKEREGSKWWSLKSGDDKWFSFDHNKLSFVKGKSYEVATDATEKDGKTYYTITSAKEKSSGGGNDGASGDRWWAPFVSNTVAHAIAAGQITDPLQIKTWAAAAKQAALEIEKATSRQPGEDDDADPFRE